MRKLRNVRPEEREIIANLDSHISPKDLEDTLALGRVLAAEEEGQITGWLRWNLFWDNTPFMNMLFVLEGSRSTGTGKTLVQEWEQRMKEAGYGIVMTSTASDEYAQHFYEKLGYRAIGGFLLPGEPYELMFAKELK